ncbi:MAG: endopeptidase La [Treponema sp.]|nr:endopeptidase La [Treponema sp.]
MKGGSGSKKAGLSSLFSGLRRDPEGEAEGGRITEERLALLPLRDLVLFPNTVVPIFITAQPGMAALDEALRRDRRLFAACLKKRDLGSAPEEPWPVGTVARVVQHLRLPDSTMRVVLQGEYRGRIVGEERMDGFSLVDVAPIEAELFGDPPRPDDVALMRSAQKSFAQYAELSKKIGSETLLAVERTESPERMANLICNSSQLKPEKKVELLAISGARERLEAILDTLERENEIFGIQKNISGKVRSRMEKNQREYYLNEQIKEINRELGNAADEFDELERRVEERNPPAEALDKARREIARLRKLQPFSPEAGVLRGYVEWLADLPWSERSADSGDLEEAQRILDEDHFNMIRAKDRVMEFIAVKRLFSGGESGGYKPAGYNPADHEPTDFESEDYDPEGYNPSGDRAPEAKGPILCFVGPPGTGKTSLGKSVARALGRRFVRISLGGLRDEAEIRGHRKTYVGALPGKILQSMRKAGTTNPVILLDEIDKMSGDFRGDPASALLEVLDPEQNAGFSDHYLEVPYDLSGALFIATANSLHGIPYALLDRMETIEVPGYGENEKLAIAKRFLVPKELRENGLERARVVFSDEALSDIIRYWTMESGVRGLEREIARCIRRVARKAVAEGYGAEKPVGNFSRTIEAENLEEIMGRRKYKKDVSLREARVGVSCGLAWTEAGGATLMIESSACPGSGEVILTGNLGEVMKESARIALSFLRGGKGRPAGLGAYPYSAQDIGKTDFHIHVPAGAIPKDGPSAGVAIAASLLSTLCARAPRPGVAMTGELTLTGRVLQIGGLKEKLLAAIRGGMEKAILPADNRSEWEELDADIKEAIPVEFVEGAEEAFALLFEKTEPKKKAAKGAATDNSTN